MTRRRPPALRRDDRLKTRDLRWLDRKVLDLLAVRGLTLVSPWADIVNCLHDLSQSPVLYVEAARQTIERHQATARQPSTPTLGGDDATVA